ncbi:hypothetical protein PV11_09884 [Exophiala sideris]|uniref:DUF7587 domain-containing protein n=1 Tax=Exophiala sideris TaxID=1016849 RepID=A0A0D1WSS2_9EURO|nr:hypothetical protein PV11_09884 [Exophiala sideris]
MEDQNLLDILNQATPKHVWSTADRELLAVAEKLYDMSNKELTLLFNHLRRDRLREEGFTEGLRVTAIAAQMSDLRRSKRGDEFRNILSMAPTAVRGEHTTLTTIIEEAAQGLGISLQSYADYGGPTSISTLKRPPTAKVADWAGNTDDEEDCDLRAKRQRIIRTPSPIAFSREDIRGSIETSTATSYATFTTLSGYSSSFVDSNSPGSYLPKSDDGDNDYQDLDEQHFARSSDRIPPLLKVTFDDKGRVAAKRPRLLFRAYDPEHGLVARRFLGPPMTRTIYRPPSVTSDEFRDMATRHLSEDKTLMSPFLSWAENPRRALKYVKRSDSPKSLAIVDYNVVEENLIRKFGKSAAIWVVPNLCRRFNLTDLVKIHDEKSTITQRRRNHYTGAGEFLIWGSVDCDLVGTLNSEQAKELYATMEDMEEPSYEAGSVLSKYLQRIDVIYREVVSYKLHRVFQKTHLVKGSSRYELFIRGVYGEDPVVTSDEYSTDDDQDSVNSLRNDEPDNISGRGFNKLQGRSSVSTTNWLSIKEEELQGLVDTQLNGTSVLFGKTMADDSMAEPEANGTTDTTKAIATDSSATTNGAVDYVKVESSQSEPISTKVLDIPGWQPTKPLPSGRDPGKGLLRWRSSARFNAVKVLEDQHTTILAKDDKAASTHEPQRETRRFTNTSSRRRSSFYVDVEDDHYLPYNRPRKKKSQTDPFAEAASTKTADNHPTRSQTDTIPQINTSQTAEQPPNTESSNGFTVETLNNIQEEADDELEIIGTTIRQRRTVKTRTQTVLTVRSRSASEAAFGAKH